MTSHASPHAVFLKNDGGWLATALSRGPWDERAQHGGAAAALLVHVAESEGPGPDWQLARMSMELIKPVPVAQLSTRTEISIARSTARMSVDLHSGDQRSGDRDSGDSLVARAHLLFMKGQAVELPPAVPGWAQESLLPGPGDSAGPAVIPGMPTGESFYYTAMEHRMATGDVAAPGPAAAWFRLRVPLIAGVDTSPFMLAAAVADSGSGISWVLPPEQYLFANADLSVHVHRPPAGEWLGMASQTQVDPDGTGTTCSTLYDTQGPIGVAVQSLVVRNRRR